MVVALCAVSAQSRVKTLASRRSDRVTVQLAAASTRVCVFELWDLEAMSVSRSNWLQFESFLIEKHKAGATHTWLERRLSLCMHSLQIA
jgi:hypothetical protein